MVRCIKTSVGLSISHQQQGKSQAVEPQGSEAPKGCYVTKALAQVLVNTAQWGKTKVNFGRLKSRNWSYMDLCNQQKRKPKGM